MAVKDKWYGEQNSGVTNHLDKAMSHLAAAMTGCKDSDLRSKISAARESIRPLIGQSQK